VSVEISERRGETNGALDGLVAKLTRRADGARAASRRFAPV
jgi:hypothetical protein